MHWVHAFSRWTDGVFEISTVVSPLWTSHTANPCLLLWVSCTGISTFVENEDPLRSFIMHIIAPALVYFTPSVLIPALIPFHLGKEISYLIMQTLNPHSGNLSPTQPQGRSFNKRRWPSHIPAEIL